VYRGISETGFLQYFLLFAKLKQKSGPRSQCCAGLIGSGITDGGHGARRSLWQANCKKWARLLPCISIFSILLIFSRFLCLAFFKKFIGVFSGDFGC